MSLQIKTKIYICLFSIIVLFVVIPSLLYLIRKIKSICYPINFGTSHVLIIGGSNGLGKEIVKEVFTKGAVVTIVGRDKASMEDIASNLDPGGKVDRPLIQFLETDILDLSSTDVKFFLKKAEE